jgi:S-DNA-T family DNA segregation ATPase FtsK/SpoIIIE
MANTKNIKNKNIKEKEDKQMSLNLPNPFDSLKSEVKRGIASIFMFCLMLIFGLSAFAKAGVGGSLIFKLFYSLFGIGYYLMPVCFLILAIHLLRSRREKNPHYGFTVGGLSMSVFGFLGMIDLISPMSGGYFGKFFGAIERLFGIYAGFAILLSIFISGVIIATEAQLNLNILLLILNLFKKKGKQELNVKGEEGIINENKIDLRKENPEDKLKEKKPERAEVNILNGDQEKAKEVELLHKKKIENYKLPPLDLLENQTGKPTVGDVRANANIVQRTLENFGVNVEMCDVCIGPTVTQYTLKPAEGTKLSKITGLHNDLALALAAHPIRIEAPIPGKSLVGIEVPNKAVTTVRLRNLLSTEEFQKSEECLLFPIGRNVANEPIYANLAKMPHMLFAGATGTGKSVGLHSFVMSLLYRNPPDQLKFIMIDPKRVELSHYEGIPHLITPVITDNKKALPALR